MLVGLMGYRLASACCSTCTLNEILYFPFTYEIPLPCWTSRLPGGSVGFLYDQSNVGWPRSGAGAPKVKPSITTPGTNACVRQRRAAAAMHDVAANPHATRSRTFRLVVVTPALIPINLFLYAIYIFLFHKVLSILKSRIPSADLRFHKITLILLFVLASVSVPIALVDGLVNAADALWTYEGVELSAHMRDVIDNLDICRYLMLLVMGFAGDSIMIFRCYVLWGYKKRYVVGPLVVLLLIDLVAIATSILALESRSQILGVVSNGCLVANGVFNLILASMIAGRLFWISRKRRNILEEAMVKRFNNIMSILLESGFLLVVAMVVDFVGNSLPDEYVFQAGFVLIQMAGIAPTLIVVRANACRDGCEAGVVDSCGQDRTTDRTTAGDLESHLDSVDLQARPRL
ncbi:hypothetical protein PM082_009840 [Marasmius tenuissimus]|nr:hypothetical protein PM082_009840 [Marasmius tenuissimus]